MEQKPERRIKSMVSIAQITPNSQLRAASQGMRTQEPVTWPLALLPGIE